MLTHLIGVARAPGFRRVSLETGTTVAYAPARALHQSAGLVGCGPFASYQASQHNLFMTLELEAAQAAHVSSIEIVDQLLSRLGGRRPPWRWQQAESLQPPGPAAVVVLQWNVIQRYRAAVRHRAAVIPVNGVPQQPPGQYRNGDLRGSFVAVFTRRARRPRLRFRLFA